jgi:signal transduction histidine kinase
MEKRAEVFKNGESVIHEMSVELRNFCFDLMPQTLVKRGLNSTLREFGIRVSQARKVKCEVIGLDNKERLPNLVEISLFRITQVWVNYGLNKANATSIVIQVTREVSKVTLTIEDNGEGFDSEGFYKDSGNSWINIQARLNQINAQFKIDSHQGDKSTKAAINVAIVPTPVVGGDKTSQLPVSIL